MSWLSTINVEDLVNNAPALEIYESLPAMGFEEDKAVKSMIFTEGYFVTNTEGEPLKKMENTENLPSNAVWTVVKHTLIRSNSDNFHLKYKQLNDR
ncbi:hypothetical protein [Psychromonas hadalis]|uniref:hypothetical protein n=1 Tax=Psychromonas hadalis TaxID=211669 RepID=UPI0003B6DEC9|nr:hypothetical protein [Psychromonas hadalis]